MFPGFAVPPTALAPKTGIRKMGSIRNKGAADRSGVSDEGLGAPEVKSSKRDIGFSEN